MFIVVPQAPVFAKPSKSAFNDPAVDGRHIRDIILPPDVLVIVILQNGDSVLPHGYTTLHLHDEVTLIGSPASLQKVTLKLGF